ncbi:FAD-dependent oxidoreductase [Actinomadura rupiterrae]|uniref:FAD-dependent oxidoreductase n=1 Tax=Actinomadura rupiterrae TaxID=559627 RepID=UPI0020A37435|nr:FAD-dependent monooxygenase [Actinomadura rupiterrae]MCP2336092.1 2-polyprenyl-6-methoxyphenol hydroxylase-like FAD-dependent oxidoreductase [Actinomadura rupiterrae]
MSEHLGDRAVVLGGGMAGLLTARVLADRYREVLVLDRDALVGVTEPRRGVPQARHAHALLARGQGVLEDLFPGLTADLDASPDVLIGDLSGDLRWYFNGVPLAQHPSGLLSISATRPALEAHVRGRVAALPNVAFRERVAVRGLVSGPGGTRVTGVRFGPDGEPGPDETLDADLVVDATGRGSRAPGWVQNLGYPRPAEEHIRIDLTYTSRFFKLNSDPFGDDLAINPVASPANPRGAFFGKFPGGIALLSLTGILGDKPPRDDEGFLEFARSLDAPEVYEAVKIAEPVGEATSFHVPSSVRRRFDRLPRFPEGLLVIGDAVCSFNPVYGQGMTVAAMEAAALAGHLAKGPARPLEFFQEIAPIIANPWEISAGGDLAFPGVEGPRNLQVRMGNAYMKRLHAAATRDGRFSAAFFRVAGLVDPPQALMRPELVLGVLADAFGMRGGEPSATDRKPAAAAGTGSGGTGTDTAA